MGACNSSAPLSLLRWLQAELDDCAPTSLSLYKTSSLALNAANCLCYTAPLSPTYPVIRRHSDSLTNCSISPIDQFTRPGPVSVFILQFFKKLEIKFKSAWNTILNYSVKIQKSIIHVLVIDQNYEFWAPFLHCVSKSIPDIFDRNLKTNYQILIIFGTNIPGTTCHHITIRCFTSPNVCFCTT